MYFGCNSMFGSLELHSIDFIFNLVLFCYLSLRLCSLGFEPVLMDLGNFNQRQVDIFMYALICLSPLGFDDL